MAVLGKESRKVYRWGGALLALLLSWGCSDGSNPTSLSTPENSTSAGGNQGTGNQGASDVKAPFIVVLGQQDSPAAVAHDHGIVPKHTFTRVLNGFAGDISEAARSGLLRDARVVRVERDEEVEAQEEVQPSPPWGLDRVDQRATELDGSYLYRGTGAGVTAYVVDTGIRYGHTDFEGRASLGYDIFGDDGSDCNGHGTHVAGILGGATYGVAKDVSLVSVRILGCGGFGFSSGVIAGLDWIAGQATGPSVVNLSLATGGSRAVDAAVARLTELGVSVVAAAGNDNDDACLLSPARAPSALTVAASSETDARAEFSNWGPCVDLFAPGVSVPSASYESDQGSAIMSGTSMASPHVAGAVALYLSESPDASPAQVASAVLGSATPGIISSARSENNRLLYTLDLVAPPPGDGDQDPANISPTAGFSVSCEGLSCTFSDQSLDVDGTLVQWSWDYGDGGQEVLSDAADASTRVHDYAADGDYTVVLTVTDDQGASGSSRQAVTVSLPGDEPVNLAPTAEFSVSCQALECTFVDASSDPDGQVVQWGWDFGDGVQEVVNEASLVSSPSHAYALPGTYEVTLEITDDGGASNSLSRVVTVEVDTPPPPPPPPPPIELTAVGNKDKGLHIIDLEWSGAQGDLVELWLGEALLDTTENDGEYGYSTENRGKGFYLFKVCEVGGTRCSPEVEVVF